MQPGASGDGDFESLYRREFAAVAAVAAALTGDRDLGADLAHEAFLRAYRDWGRLSAFDRPGAWVRRVVINLASDARRTRGRESRAFGRVGTRPSAEQPAATDDAFWDAVRGLPDRQRDAALLRYAADMSVEQIAGVMGISDGTVKATLFKARRALAAQLQIEEVSDDVG